MEDDGLTVKNVPADILEAYNVLLQNRIVEITRPIEWSDKKGAWVFEFSAQIPPNNNCLPSSAIILAAIEGSYPFGSLDFYSLDNDVSGFPHQDLDGKLCLPNDPTVPLDKNLLTCHVFWVIEWLSDAANNTLLKQSDPYELPKFPWKAKQPYTVFYNESSRTYEKWVQQIGKIGIVESNIGSFGTLKYGLFASRFLKQNGEILLESSFDKFIVDQEKIISGKWCLLPEICFTRHRPPLSYQEINQMFSLNDLDFLGLLKQVWEMDNCLNIGLILIGFPIPFLYGEALKEIHWQPIIISTVRSEALNREERRKQKPMQIWHKLINEGRFKPQENIHWGSSVNLASERLYSRGGFSTSFTNLHFALFGCGALGSVIAESLVRGGVSKLELFDSDIITYGNYCRHTLDGSCYGLCKANALATRLSSTNPLSKMTAHSIKIPFNKDKYCSSQEAFENADIFIDCTTDESAFQWLSQYASCNYKRMISLFFNFHANILTMCSSGNITTCSEVFQDLKKDIGEGNTPISQETYFYQPTKEEQIIEGAGCWHPTFPAQNNHIIMLAATAIDIMHSRLEGNSDGLAALIKRSSFPERRSIIEIVWLKDYK
jgi:molybdopterin/thiamine biosynthesis adenylyltransferase